MARWEPDARGRLAVAAMDLYATQGFDETTVAEIAARAGVTERTFFRHFADKREVLFQGSERLEEEIVAGIGRAPGTASPLEAAAAGILAAPAVMPDVAYARRRALAVSRNASLQERELLKLSSLSEAVASALRARGIEDLPARVTADAAVSMFHHGFSLWISAEGPDDLAACLRLALAAIRAVA